MPLDFFGTHNNPDISWETKWFWSTSKSFFSFLFFFQHPSGLDRVRTAIVCSYSLKVAELRWEFCEGSGRRYWLQVGHSIHRSAVAIRMKPWWLKWCQNFSAVITFFWQKLIMWENKIIQNHLIDISNTLTKWRLIVSRISLLYKKPLALGAPSINI